MVEERGIILSNEIWKDIIGYDGCYKVSNIGNVKSLKRKSEIILKPRMDKDGYSIVNLYKNGKNKVAKIHRLVAMSFIENEHNLPQVNHIDEVKTNNCVSNLEWMSARDNINYGTGIERRCKEVIQILNGVEIARFNSAVEVNQKLGFEKTTISRCCNGQYKKAYGYKWKYAKAGDD